MIETIARILEMAMSVRQAIMMARDKPRTHEANLRANIVFDCMTHAVTWYTIHAGCQTEGQTGSSATHSHPLQ